MGLALGLWHPVKARSAWEIFVKFIFILHITSWCGGLFSGEDESVGECVADLVGGLCWFSLLCVHFYSSHILRVLSHDMRMLVHTMI